MTPKPATGGTRFTTKDGHDGEEIQEEKGLLNRTGCGWITYRQPRSAPQFWCDWTMHWEGRLDG